MILFLKYTHRFVAHDATFSRSLKLLIYNKNNPRITFKNDCQWSLCRVPHALRLYTERQRKFLDDHYFVITYTTYSGIMFEKVSHFSKIYYRTFLGP